MWLRTIKGVVRLLAILCLTGQAAAAEKDYATEYAENIAEIEKMFFPAEEKEQDFISATGWYKPLDQIAENVTVIRADEIEAMNVHTVDEVLNRVAGLFVDFGPWDFGGGNTATFIHGSSYEHVLVLFDGIRWNLLSDQIALTNSIPVQAIDRIEIIKGAASSTWGSSLGGVINIITRDPAASEKPVGMASGSLGEHDTREYRGEVTGKTGRLGYYLTANRQTSDGIRDHRFFDNTGIYGKLRYSLPSRPGFVAFSVAAANPEYRYIHFVPFDFAAEVDSSYLLYTAHLNVGLTKNLYWDFQAGRRHLDFSPALNFISDGQVFFDNEFDEQTTTISTRLALTLAQQQIILGLEYERGEEKDSAIGFRAPAIFDENFALYVNDTIRLDSLTLIPGVRFDHFLNSDNQLSPSLGAVYKIDDHLLLRAGISRGFRRPTIGFLKGDPTIFGPNSPQLEAEKIQTYQVGLEKFTPSLGRLKTTLFLHDAEDVWQREDDGTFSNNGGDINRYGAEIEMETVSFHDFSLAANTTYVYFNRDRLTNDELYNAKIILKYNDHRTLDLQLFGHYVWWGQVMAPPSFVERDGNFVWGLTGTKLLRSTARMDLQLFGSIHNIFDTEQYRDEIASNTDRWIEAGIRILF